MGLFNRNKGDAPAPSTPEAGTKPADGSTFDFDAISRDLDAQNGASSFDSLLAAPATPAQQTEPGDSPFDFPENDPLGLSTPPTNPATPATRETTPLVGSPEGVINAPLIPDASPTTGVAPLEGAPVVSPTPPVAAPKEKKPLPLVPLLGALGLLAVVGGGAMFLLNSGQEPETTPVAPPPAVVSNSGAPSAPGAPGASAAPPAPGVVGVPVVPPATSGAPGAPATGLRSASPGIAPPPAPKQPISSGSSSVSVVVGQKPTTRLPSATAELDPALASRLKALWRAGADAKHKRDYKAARAAWGEALRLRPGHPGFQDSINQLPQ